jgi:enoyl-CoA hydratase
LRIGLANHVVPHDELLPFACALARDIAEQDGRIVSLMREGWKSIEREILGEAEGVHRRCQLAGAGSAMRSGNLARRREAVLERARTQQEGSQRPRPDTLL